jgi:integrase
MGKTNVISFPRVKEPRVLLNEAALTSMREGQRKFDSRVGGFYARRGKRGITFGAIADLPTKVWRQKLTGSPTIEMRFQADSAKAARAEAQRIIGLIKSGTDPRAPAQSPDGPTLQQAWNDYRDDYLAKTEASPKTALHYGYCFKRVTKWHGKPLSLIARNPQALKEEHARLTKDNGKVAANATLQFLSILYRHIAGQNTGWPEWPRRAYINHRPTPTAHRGMAVTELKAWWLRVQKIKNPVRREMMLFALLSGLRKTDLLTASWANVDEKARTLHLPTPKGGERRAFYLPLSVPMLACIKRARRTGNVFLFPNREAGFSEMLAPEGVKTGHDLRRSFANAAKATGIWPDDVALLMNHKLQSQTSHYQKAPDLLEAMEKISAKIMEAIKS